LPELLKFDADYLLAAGFVHALSSLRSDRDGAKLGDLRNKIADAVGEPFRRIGQTGPDAKLPEPTELRNEYKAVLGELERERKGVRIPDRGDADVAIEEMLTIGHYHLFRYERDPTDLTQPKGNAKRDHERLLRGQLLQYVAYRSGETTPLNGLEMVLAFLFPFQLFQKNPDGYLEPIDTHDGIVVPGLDTGYETAALGAGFDEFLFEKLHDDPSLRGLRDQWDGFWVPSDEGDRRTPARIAHQLLSWKYCVAPSSVAGGMEKADRQPRPPSLVDIDPNRAWDEVGEWTRDADRISEMDSDKRRRSVSPKPVAAALERNSGLPRWATRKARKCGLKPDQVEAVVRFESKPSWSKAALSSPAGGTSRRRKAQTKKKPK